MSRAKGTCMSTLYNALELMSHDDEHSALHRKIFQWKAEELSASFLYKIGFRLMRIMP